MQLTLKLRTRLLLTYLLPTLAIVGVVGAMAYVLASRALEQALGDRLVSVAEAAAISLRPADVGFVRPGDEDSRTYKRLRAGLEKLRDATGSERLVLFDTQQRALCDSEGSYPIGARVPDLSRDSLEVSEVLAGHPRASAVLFTGSDGRRYKSGYAPVIDRKIAIAGVLVDGRAGFFDALDSLGAGVAGVGLLGLLGVALLSLLFSRLLAGPIGRLASAAARIGEGDLSTPIEATGRIAEVLTLARALEQMRGELQARERELQMMLGGIAHEVRNPLGGIELFSGLLAEELSENEDHLGYVKRIQKELGHLAKLVDEFLDYAREREPQRSEINLAELYFELSQIVAPDAEARQLQIKIEVAPTLQAFADPSLLRRALLNLLRNAIQASPEQGQVTLGATEQGTELLMSIEDQGTGVPEEQRERVLEPFFTTKEKGSGLGLALAAKTAKVHGGRLSIESAKGGGARFLLSLPKAL